jgi:hypothetical protein
MWEVNGKNLIFENMITPLYFALENEFDEIRLSLFCKIRWHIKVQSNTDNCSSFVSICINPVY